MVYCAAYIFRQQQRRMDMSAVTAGFIWIIIIIISLLFFGFQCQYSRLQELYAEKSADTAGIGEYGIFLMKKVQQGQDTIRNIRHDMKTACPVYWRQCRTRVKTDSGLKQNSKMRWA